MKSRVKRIVKTLCLSLAYVIAIPFIPFVVVAVEQSFELPEENGGFLKRAFNVARYFLSGCLLAIVLPFATLMLLKHGDDFDFED